MRLTFPSVTMAITIAVAMAGPAAAGSSYETDVFFEGGRAHDPNGGTLLDFYGTVDSNGPGKCAKDRILFIHKTVDGPDPGPDTELGYTRSDSGGFWSFTIPASDVQPGTYYAKTPKHRLAGGGVCRADKSNEYLIT
jgi:hypothetical protein